MLRDMNMGCLSFLILFPAGIFIWAAGEKQRRDALPPEELKKLEAEEDYGPLDEKLECIFCHSKNCVRAQNEDYYIGGPEKNSPAGLTYLMTLAAVDRHIAARMVKTEKRAFAHCMKCSNTWEMYLPDEIANQ